MEVLIYGYNIIIVIKRKRREKRKILWTLIAGVVLPDTANGNWDVLIGHMLGVDHVGHRHGPDHPAMRAKLDEVDEVIKKIITILQESELAKDTALFVMVLLIIINHY